MGVFTLMYETEIAPQLELAIETAMKTDVKDTAMRIVEESANERIYQAYSPKFWSRRGSFRSDHGYDVEVVGNKLTITATEPLQNLYGNSHHENLGDIIAEGWGNFYMPFPRPWLDEGAEAHLAELENALAVGMMKQGF